MSAPVYSLLGFALLLGAGAGLAQTPEPLSATVPASTPAPGRAPGLPEVSLPVWRSDQVVLELAPTVDLAALPRLPAAITTELGTWHRLATARLASEPLTDVLQLRLTGARPPAARELEIRHGSRRIQIPARWSALFRLLREWFPKGADPVDDTHPRLSPDGKLLAWRRRTGDGVRLRVESLESGISWESPRWDPALVAGDVDPVWAPRSDVVACRASRGVQILRLPASPSAAAVWEGCFGGADVDSCVFSPSSRLLAGVVDRRQVLLAERLARRFWAITEAPPAAGSRLYWSPSGRRLAFLSLAPLGLRQLPGAPGQSASGSPGAATGAGLRLTMVDFRLLEATTVALGGDPSDRLADLRWSTSESVVLAHLISEAPARQHRLVRTALAQGAGRTEILSGERDLVVLGETPTAGPGSAWQLVREHRLARLEDGARIRVVMLESSAELRDALLPATPGGSVSGGVEDPAVRLVVTQGELQSQRGLDSIWVSLPARHALRPALSAAPAQRGLFDLDFRASTPPVLVLNRLNEAGLAQIEIHRRGGKGSLARVLSGTGPSGGTTDAGNGDRQVPAEAALPRVAQELGALRPDSWIAPALAGLAGLLLVLFLSRRRALR